ncbi:MarR family transcriptional regulator [Burkholderia multivorans]
MMFPVLADAPTASGGFAARMGELHGLLVANASFQRMLNQTLMSRLGLSVTQGSALVHLARHCDLSCQELAKLTGCGASRISRLAQELEKLRLVTVRRDSADRRVVKLALTSDGAALAYRVPESFREAECKFLARLSGEEARLLGSLLTRMADNLGRVAG